MKKKLEEIHDLEKETDYEELIESLVSIKNAIERDDILKAGNEFGFYSPGHYEDLDDELDNHLQQIVLELTGKCNLRCSYCIYSEDYKDKRNFNDKEMSEEVALTFYGGEPLIKFNLLKKCIEYAKKQLLIEKFLIH